MKRDNPKETELVLKIDKYLATWELLERFNALPDKAGQMAHVSILLHALKDKAKDHEGMAEGLIEALKEIHDHSIQIRRYSA